MSLGNLLGAADFTYKVADITFITFIFFLIIIWHFSHLIVLRVTSLVVVNHGSVKACFSLQQQLSAALWDDIGKLQC